MKSKMPVVVFVILLIVVLSVRVPFFNASANAAPRDYCDGFQNPPVPSLTQEPFALHIYPGMLYPLPGLIVDLDNDGDVDVPSLETRKDWNSFRPDSVVDGLVDSQVSGGPGFLYFHGMAAMDLDNDGLKDLIVAPYYAVGTPIMFFRNLGNWRFESSHQDFLRNLLGFNSSSAWYSETIIIADLTGDGLNDIYIPLYTYTEPFQSVFLRNTGTGFVEEAIVRGIGLPNIPIDFRPEGAQAVDIDDDGDLDFYVAHHLFMNDGNGYFTDAREAYGLPILFDEGIAFIDYDNDGLLDLHIRTPFIDQQLFRNTGNGFVNVSVSSGLACLTQNHPFYWGGNWADFDLDGDIDFLPVAAQLEGTTIPSRRTRAPRVIDSWYYLLLNQGDGTFRLGFSKDRFFQFSAMADFDLDGDLDIYSIDVTGAANVFENLFGVPQNTFALAVVPVDNQRRMNQEGTTVRVKHLCSSPPRVQTRVIGINNVYLAQGDYTAHFGVAGNCSYEIEVAFIKRGAEPRQVVTIPYKPQTEGSLKIFVSRTGATKEPYPGFRNFLILPTIMQNSALQRPSR
jgi:hypothetical protein